eukprot:5525788-Lingulodinium_polyedra.AAC.1
MSLRRDSRSCSDRADEAHPTLSWLSAPVLRTTCRRTSSGSTGQVSFPKCRGCGSRGVGRKGSPPGWSR